MKTITYLFALLFCCLTIHSDAQISLGVRGGYGKAWEDYGDAEVPENAKIHIPGYQASAIINVGLGKIFRLGVEPGFVRRGAACIPTFVTFTNDVKWMLNYVEMPVILTGKIPVNQKLEIFGKAGYGVSYMTSATAVFIDLTGALPPSKQPMDLDNPFGTNIRRWDNGIYTGLGIGYNTPFGQVFLDSNYYVGMRDVTGGSTSKSRNLQLGLGLTVSL